MKRSVKDLLTKVLSVTLTAAMLLPAYPALETRAKEELVNVALEATAATANNSSGSSQISWVNDGNDQTAWQTPGQWPAKVELDLNGNRNVSKVVVKLGGTAEESIRTVELNVQYAQNGITSDLISFGTKAECPMSQDAELSSAPVSASHIYVELANPKDPNVNPASFWPSIREIEVYESQEVKLSEYNNIANQAVVTTDGAGANDSGLLTDQNPATLYKFHGSQQSVEKYVDLDFAGQRTIDALAIYFEHVTNEPYNYQYVYSILGKTPAIGEISPDAPNNGYVTLADHVTANRTDNYYQEYKINPALFTNIRIVIHSTTTNQGNGWPAIAELEVYGSEEEVSDTDNIAWKKPVHSSSAKTLADNVNDGSKRTAWKGTYYPAYVDIDLEQNYNLDNIEVYTPSNGYSQYSIYTSMDGRDFAKLAEKTSTDSADSELGEVYLAEGKEARIIRVYMEYNSASTQAVINEIRAAGTPSNTPVQQTPALNISKYADTSYHVDITNQDTYEELNGIITRRLGEKYQSWFSFELKENPKGTGHDFFRMEEKDGKIHITGNSGVSMAMGLNHYLKYFCQVNIAQTGDQAKMPETKPALGSPVFKETKVKTRYSYNYCTLSYSMAFWGEEEWRNELDWLALNGVNVVLDATAQEEVWRRFLSDLGYTHAEIKDFIAGPAYYAWAYMANLSGFGGPVHDSWFEERTELARKNQLIMRKLGMQPVLQGYSGMVPNDIKDHDPNAQVIGQGSWCSFQRPDMLETTSSTFTKYASKFYQFQKEVYGDSAHYYATDPFHEGGDTGQMEPAKISSSVLDSMLAADPDAVWIIQSWQGNPTSELLKGLGERKEHALVLDLYAEKTPHYNEGSSNNNLYGYDKEFDNTPWAFCMLNNFGGRLGLHGHLDNLANNIPKALNDSKHMVGIGITPEASYNNPVLYDFVFETVWQDDAAQELPVINLDNWLNAYAQRRYGAKSKSAQEAWSILKDTVYRAEYNNLGQGAPESVVNARPDLDINAASTWGNAVISYDKEKLEKAAALLMKDYDILKDSEGYRYDLASVLQQVLSNSAQEYQNKMTKAYRAGDLEQFQKNSQIFLAIIDQMEQVTSTSEYYLLGRWVEQAKALAVNADDFTKELYEFNAKTLITTWGSYNQSETGGLKDYSNRQWSGLISDFYKVRWQRWITAKTNELAGESYEQSINWFQWEWQWARSNDKSYTTEPSVNVNLKEVGTAILENYSAANPDKNPSSDIHVSKITVETGSYEPNIKGEGDPIYVLDGNNNTIWHTAYAGSERADQWLVFTLAESEVINGMRFLQRPSGPNGVVTKYDLLIKKDGDVDWTPVITGGSLMKEAQWQKVSFEPIKAKQIKFQVADAQPATGKKFAAAAEVRFTSDNAKLLNKLEEAKAIDKSKYTKKSVEELDKSIADAEALAKNPNAAAEMINAAVEAIDNAINGLVWKADKTALDAAVKEAEKVQNDNYTQKSWDDFQAALQNAITVNQKDDATQKQADEALKALNDAKANLKKEVPADIPVTKVTVTPATLAMKVNDTAALKAEIAPANATDKIITWTSNNPGIASVDKTTGKVTAKASGTAAITAQSSNQAVKGTCNVTVAPTAPPAPPASNKIAVTKITVAGSLTVARGSTKTLEATVAPSNATNKNVTWTSSNKKVATVTKTGTVKGIKAGTATITAKSANGKTDTCKLTVAEVTLNAKSVPLQVGKTTTALKMTAYPSNDKAASWKTSSNKIVTVDKKGKLKGIKTRKATITVTMKSGAKASCTVTVQKSKVVTKSIKLSEKTMNLLKGKKKTLAVTRNPITGTEKITWTSSNKKAAVVNSKGIVTAKAPGKATITAKTANGKKAACTIYVPGVTLKAASSTIKVKGTCAIKIKSTVVPKDKAAFTSSNKKIAVVDSKGKVKGIKPGKATITVTMKSGAKATFKVTVKSNK